jgi:hypothetical protein
MQTTAESQRGDQSFLVRGWRFFFDRGTAVQETDTSIDDHRSGRLVAQLEKKLEQLQKDVRARDQRIAELQFQIARLETRMYELFERAADARR